jgi:hypothetical protein
MKRWRVELEAGDGSKGSVVVGATTRRGAEGHARVREWVAARPGGHVVGVQRVIPGVVWREPWGYYLAVRRAGKRYYESLQTMDAETAAVRAEAKLEAIAGEKWGRLAATRVRRTCATIAEVLGVYEAHCRDQGEPRAVTVRQNVWSVGRVLQEVGLDASVGADRLCGATLREFVASWIAKATGGGRSLDVARRTIGAIAVHARSVVGPRYVEVYEEAGLVVPREAWAEFRERSLPATKPARWDRPAAAALAGLTEAARVLRDQAAAGGEIRLDTSRRGLATAAGLWTVWVLARCLGMRAREMACARWGWFEIQQGGGVAVSIRPRETEGYEPKGAAGAVPVHPDVWAELVRLRGGAADEAYVLPGGCEGARYEVPMQFSAWARGAGYVGRRHGAHDLRAISADEIALSDWGPWVADRFLRHAPASVGDRHYRELRLPAGFPGVGLWGLDA